MSNDRRLETSLCICEIKPRGNARRGYNRYAEKADRVIHQQFTLFLRRNGECLKTPRDDRLVGRLRPRRRTL
jgi:hypothetical protein